MEYSEPEYGAARWLAGSKGVTAKDQSQQLLSNMFTRTSSLATAAVSELIVACAALLRDPKPAFTLWLLAGILLLAARLLLIQRARANARAGLPTHTDFLVWSAILWAAEIGTGTLLCDLSGDPLLQLLSNVCITAILGGLVARNASTPRLAAAQVVITLSLLSIGTAFASEVWLRVLLVQAPVYGAGLISVCFRINRELVAMLSAQNENALLARQDMLTKLPNRISVNETLDALLMNPFADPFAVLWVDLDGFKLVNDSLGHAAGDAVLVDTGSRLRALCPASSLVARQGGDEFLVIAPRLDEEGAAELATAIIAAIALPFVFANAPAVRLDASIGISLFPQHGRDADLLLIVADKALYAVKASGKAAYAIYNPHVHAGEDDLILFRSDLEHALEADDGEFMLEYQPIVRIEDARVVAREALLRWDHPRRGLVSPDEFIPVAEASGLILMVGEWVLRTACRDAVRWADPVQVAVNVSPMQLRSDRFLPMVQAALCESGLSATRLELEVTETVLLDKDEVTKCNMIGLRALGISLALDDFGTGFSSLSNLCRFAFDRIKIDGSFVQEALDRRECAAIIRATVQLARELNVPTTAECIETIEQLDFVRACGCTDAQGFLLGYPNDLSGIPLNTPAADFQRRKAAA